jgi:ADP-L-glycero-D-manno-heptose 6-epimerase
MIILTGGAGFIGTNMLHRLNRMGCEDVLVVDNIAASDKWKNLVGATFRQYIQKDRLWEWLDSRPAAPLEAVIHLGACTDTMESDFDYLAENNLHYSQRLWQLCTQKQIPFVYASSAATYGDGAIGFSDDHSQILRYRPINPYGFSKHLFDLWALKQVDSPSRWYGLKFFNVYGPYENHKGRMASVAYFAIPQALEKGQIRLFKSGRSDYRDGEQKRDFVFVGDVVSIATHFLNNAAPSGIYNAGSGRAQTFNQLAAAIFNALKKPVNIEYFDMPETLQGSYQYFTEADMSKIVEAGCNFQPTSLEEGIHQYCDWLLKDRSERV